MHAIGYTRVSTNEQHESGAGLGGQRVAIEGTAMARGWEISWLEEDGASATTMKRRPALAKALEMLAAGEAQVLIVSKLDRLARNALDFLAMMSTAKREGWEVVVLDLGVDTTTPFGECALTMLAAIAQMESRVIGERTRDAMAYCISQGRPVSRPSPSPEALAMIKALREDGHGYRKTADILNARQIPTARDGAQWYHSSVASAEKAAQRRVGAAA